MTNVESRVYRAQNDLATLPDSIEDRVEKVLGRYFYGSVVDDPPLARALDPIVDRWVAERGKVSGRDREVLAIGVAQDLCNLAYQIRRERRP